MLKSIVRTWKAAPLNMKVLAVGIPLTPLIGGAYVGLLHGREEGVTHALRIAAVWLGLLGFALARRGTL